MHRIPLAITEHRCRAAGGAVTAVFVMLVASIHTGDHHHLTAAPDGQIEALTRTMLAVGVRTGPAAAAPTAMRTGR